MYCTNMNNAAMRRCRRRCDFFRGDLTQESLLTEAIAGVDVVFHLLWTTTAIHEIANRDPIADVNANLVPTLQLLEAARRCGVGRLVFTSSGGTVYGPTTVKPIPETHAQNPINAYGVSKLAIEKYCRCTVICMGWIRSFCALPCRTAPGRTRLGGRERRPFSSTG
jgi:nucleoside-diphosphate-sugar epimerase